MRNFIFTFIILISATAQNVTDTLRIGTLEDPARLISPYSDFTINKDFFIEQTFGRGLYFFEESQLVTTDIESIRFDDDKLIFLLSPSARFSVEDIIATFEHYKDYYQRSANPKYYFYSKVTELQTINGGFSFRILNKEIGLFNRIYLTYPILNSVDIDQIKAKTQLIRSEYSTYSVGQISSNKGLRFSLKQQQSNRVNVVEVVKYDEESNFFTNAFSDNIGFFHFSEFPEFYKGSRDAISGKLSIKTITQNKNEIIFMGINDKEFGKNERDAYSRLINRNQLLSQYLGSNYELANSIYKKESRYHFNREPNEYSAVTARKQLIKEGYKQNKNAFLTKHGKDKKYKLYFPAKSSYFRQIANRIFVNFAEIDILLEPNPVSYQELIERIKSNSFDFYLIDLKHRDEEYIATLKFLNDVFFKNNKTFERHFKTLVSVNNDDAITPLIQRLQDLIQKQNTLIPLFSITKYSLMLSKKYENAVNFYSKNNQGYFELNALSKWRVNAQ